MLGAAVGVDFLLLVSIGSPYVDMLVFLHLHRVISS